MNEVEQLQTIKSHTLEMLNELTSIPKPTYTVDGHTVSWSEYQKILLETINWCDIKLKQIQPCEFQTQATTCDYPVCNYIP